jgi:precorrin-6Y C5,15-methyltransferase (decarboxylating)
MPEDLAGLPDPDRVFLGGGLGKGTRVLEEALRRLRPGGRLVIHAVLLGSLQRALDLFRSRGWSFDVTQVQISRSKGLAGDLRLEPLNPVFVMAARKPEE